MHSKMVINIRFKWKLDTRGYQIQIKFDPNLNLKQKSSNKMNKKKDQDSSCEARNLNTLNYLDPTLYQDIKRRGSSSKPKYKHMLPV